LPEENLEYLRKIDPEYFSFLARVHLKELGEAENQHAAMAIRVGYSQALETFMALAAAAFQAPRFPLGWMLKYKNSELSEMIELIQNNKILPNTENTRCGWEILARAMQRETDLNTEDGANFVSVRKDLWRSFSRDFLDENFQREYNSIKHGSRANAGGFQFSIGVENPLTNEPEEPMTTITKSQYGSSFPIPKDLPGNISNFQVRTTMRNWSPTHLAHGITSLVDSIQNIIAFLQMVGGETEIKLMFRCITSERVENHILNSFHPELRGYGLKIEEEEVRKFSKEDAVTHYRETIERLFPTP